MLKTQVQLVPSSDEPFLWLTPVLRTLLFKGPHGHRRKWKLHGLEVKTPRTGFSPLPRATSKTNFHHLSSCPHLIQSPGPASGHQSPDVASWGHLPFTPPTHSFPPSGLQGCFWGLPRMLIPGCSAHASPAWLPRCTRVSAHCYTFKHLCSFGGHSSNHSIKIMP